MTVKGNEDLGEPTPQDEEKEQRWNCRDCERVLVLWSSEPDAPEDVACMVCGSLMVREGDEV